MGSPTKNEGQVKVKPDHMTAAPPNPLQSGPKAGGRCTAAELKLRGGLELTRVVMSSGKGRHRI